MWVFVITRCVRDLRVSRVLIGAMRANGPEMLSNTLCLRRFVLTSVHEIHEIDPAAHWNNAPVKHLEQSRLRFFSRGIVSRVRATARDGLLSVIRDEVRNGGNVCCHLRESLSS